MPYQKSLLDPFLESPDPNLLNQEFRERLERLIESCQNHHVEVRLGCGLRGPGTQAKMWCRSRSSEEVLARTKMIGQVAPRLMAFMESDGVKGPLQTCALPGASWHQWGEAADVYYVVNGSAVWGATVAKYVEKACGIVGLYCGTKLNMHTRKHHVQLRPEISPILLRTVYPSWADIEAEMASRFNLDLSENSPDTPEKNCYTIK